MIEEGYGRAVRMGHLAFMGSRKVNGVSQLHGELMKETVFKRLHHYFPDKITAITNGVTPRRWLLSCNPPLASLIIETIGERWIAHLEALEELAPMADDAGFVARFAAAKRRNKEGPGRADRESAVGVLVDPDALFDIQIKRIHEYKRQLLNISRRSRSTPPSRPTRADWEPRVKIFAGKAAPVLSARQADHQAHQRRRRGRQRRPRSAPG